MKIEVEAEDLLGILFPHLETRDLTIMAAIDDLSAAVQTLKTSVAQVASTLETIATRLHSHPATNNDAILEGFVGDLNTLASHLNNSVNDVTSAEAGSVLDDGTAQQPAQDPNAGGSGTSDTPGDTQPAPSDGSSESSSAPSDQGSTDPNAGADTSAPTGDGVDQAPPSDGTSDQSGHVDGGIADDTQDGAASA